MPDERKTKQELLAELRELRGRVAARDAAERFSELIHASPEPFAIVHLGPTRNRIVDVNEGFERLSGYARPELIGAYGVDLGWWKNPDDQREMMAVLAAEGAVRRWEGEFVTKTGDVLTCEISASPVDVGDRSSVLISVRDLTERKRAEEALTASERRFHALFDQSVQLGAVLQPDGRLVAVNRTALGFLTADQSPGIGRPFWETPWWAHSEPLRDALREWIGRAAAGETVPFESTHFDRAGVLHVVSATMSPIRDEADNVIYLLALGHDVTERSRLEREILEVRARERQRIGQDLHDGLGQQLTGMGFLVRALGRKLETLGLAEAEDARILQERTAEALAQTRLLARGLLPISFDPAGLAAALDELAASARDLFHLECEPLIDPAVRVDNEDVALHLYHIAREAVTNAARHANARRVTVQLARTDEGARLTITDDGSGIPDVARRGEGSGLRIMGYRAHLMQGSIAVERGPERGTVVRCNVPLAAGAG
jgi:PAS domain S-box-containing protein